MIDFQRLDLEQKARYDAILMNCGQRGCEYSFVNLFLWGRQKGAFLGNRLALLSQFDRKSVYPFPVGPGDKAQVIRELLADAQERGIPCRIIGLTEKNIHFLQVQFPDDFMYVICMIINCILFRAC